jgi:hypothetical protein
LAQLARLVNDHTSDARRHELAELTPLVIGLTSDDIRVDAHIALRSARVALPVVSAVRQNAMAVAVLRADRVLGRLAGRPAGNLDEQTRAALAEAPQAARWARDFVGDSDISESRFRRYAAPSTVRSAVQGIAEACIADPDRMLRELLVEGIRDCAAICGKTSPSHQSSREIVTS